MPRVSRPALVQARPGVGPRALSQDSRASPTPPPRPLACCSEASEGPAAQGARSQMAPCGSEAQARPGPRPLQRLGLRPSCVRKGSLWG